MADSQAIICPKSVANIPAIVTSAGTALDANPARAAFSIQNLDTDPLFVRLGAGASATVFHVVLKGCTAPDDGNGGLLLMNSGTVYTGVVTVAGTTPRFVVMEL